MRHLVAVGQDGASRSPVTVSVLEEADRGKHQPAGLQGHLPQNRGSKHGSREDQKASAGLAECGADLDDLALPPSIAWPHPHLQKEGMGAGKAPARLHNTFPQLR